MYIPKYNSYFIHIPKCAGTSIEIFLFREHNIQIQNSSFIFSELGPELGKQFHYLSPELAKKYWNKGKSLDELTIPTQHLSAHYCNKFELTEFQNSKYKFAVVRNPWEKFVSGFIYKKRFVNPYCTIEEQLRDYEKENHDSLSIQSAHDAPMWKFIYDENMNLLVDDVFQMEDLSRVEKKLSNVFNTQVNFGHYNKIQKYNYNDFLNADVRNCLLPIIKKDLEIFNYE